MSAAGWLGGHLTYALGVGVDTTAFQSLPTDWTDAAELSAIGDQPLGVDVGGVPVVLFRTAGGIAALAGRCTHRGGPLHEGQVSDGCISCPWHGSRFAADGAVRSGPATRPQPRLDTRAVNGTCADPPRRGTQPSYQSHRTLETRRGIEFMRAVTWQGKRDVRVEEVPDPKIEQPTDAIVRITSTNICGSDLHLYETLGPFMDAGDILGHEPMGIVEEVGGEVTGLSVGDRVVIPFQISCGHCFMCDQQLYTQCETTQVREYGSGAALFGYSKMYGQVPGGQAEYLRVPHAGFTHIKVPEGPDDDRFVYLSDVLPTAWQAVEYAAVPPGGTVLVLGLGPIGDMATRIAQHHGARVIAVDLVPERLERARANGCIVLDLRDYDDGELGDAVRELTDGRGADSVIDAVGMEAHGSRGPKLAQTLVGLLPDAIAQADDAARRRRPAHRACTPRSTPCAAAARSR